MAAAKFELEDLVSFLSFGVFITTSGRIVNRADEDDVVMKTLFCTC